MKELADRVVALGVGYAEEHYPGRIFYYHRDCSMPMDADEFLKQWPVTGALMEKVRDRGIEITILRDGVQVAHPKWSGYEWSDNESLALAIIEACVTALEQEATNGS